MQYEEAVQIMMKIKLDTSGCPKSEWQNWQKQMHNTGQFLRTSDSISFEK